MSEAIQEFCVRWRIRNLSVFGSVLGDNFGPNSDLDFLAEFEPNDEWDVFDEIHMREELAALVGRDVDIVDRQALESMGNRFIRREVLATAEPVHAVR